jgi:hypothetical protein
MKRIFSQIVEQEDELQRQVEELVGKGDAADRLIRFAHEVSASEKIHPLQALKKILSTVTFIIK